MARRDIRINSKGFILVFVNPFWHLPCRCYEKVFISCLSPCGWCETRRAMVEMAENIWACSRICRRLQHKRLVRDLHQAQGVHLGFCESVLQQKTQGVDFGCCQSYKICVNLWEPSNRPATGQATAIFALQIYRISTTKRFPHVGNIFRIRNIF